MNYRHLGWGVVLMLENASEDDRSIDELRSHGNRIDACDAVSYIVWFPDGTVLELLAAGPLFQDPLNRRGEPKPLAIPGNGYVQGDYRIQNSATVCFLRLYEKNKGQFCFTGVIGSIGLQSNLTSYNNCPLPPRDYFPLEHSQFTPKAREKAKLADRSRLLEAEMLRRK